MGTGYIKQMEPEKAATGEDYDNAGRVGPWTLYKEYVKAAGNWWLILLNLAFGVGGQVLLVLTDIYLVQWIQTVYTASNNNTNHTLQDQTIQLVYVTQSNASTKRMGPPTLEEFIGGVNEVWGVSEFSFILLYGSSMASIILAEHILTSFYLSASQNLHDNMFPAILASKMQFFDTYPIGSVLNRFSRDMGFVHTILPVTVRYCTKSSAGIVTMLVVVCYANAWTLLSLVPVVVFLIQLRRLSLQTLTDTKRLEASARSPIFSFLSDTLAGLQTIRALSASHRFIQEFDIRQNRHSASWFLYISSYQAFGFCCSLIAALYMPTSIFISIHLGNSIQELLVGLALIYIISLLETFETLMRKLCEADTLVGIVGRTGAKKSSVLSCLFRLAESNGNIIIDGIDIKHIGLHELRQHISVISQDPIVFQGTVRRNLDLFGSFTDEELFQVLTEVRLNDVVDRLPGKLHTEVLEAGSNFSVGQRQLLCLARTILKHNKILVLDEATANVDQKTDEIIQETIRRRFSDCTVITIALRLNTIMDSDRVMVLMDGKLVEFDEPYILLSNSASVFSRLVDQTGGSSAAQLREEAHLALAKRYGADVKKKLHVGRGKWFPVEDVQINFTQPVNPACENLEEVTHL